MLIHCGLGWIARGVTRANFLRFAAASEVSLMLDSEMLPVIYEIKLNVGSHKHT